MLIYQSAEGVHGQTVSIDANGARAFMGHFLCGLEQQSVL